MKAKAKKIQYSTSALERDYKRYLQNLSREIFASIEYWLIPMFDKNIIQDAAQDSNKKSKKPAFKDLDLGGIKVGDYVSHKKLSNLKNMLVKEISAASAKVENNGQILQFSLKDLKKENVKIPYSNNDTLQERINKIKLNTQANADEYADILAKKLLSKSLKNIDLKFKSGFGIDFNSIPFSESMKEKIKMIYENNANLIKSIPQDIIKKLDNVLQNASLGGDRYTITNALKSIKNTTENQIKTIARDQTAKALNGVSMLRAQEAGFKYYEWVTAGDERVSTGKGGHKQLNGKIFRYDKPEAIIDSYGNKGHPAQRVNCRCTAAPIYLEANQKIVKDTIGYKIVEI